ncbi:MAG: disulfide bond formation protein B [Gammaproteobacteria bacterium]
MKILSNRGLNLTACGLSVLLLSIGYYLQYVKGIQPCPLCVVQRAAFIGCGLIFLLAAVHHPREWGRRIYALFGFVFATLGIALAIRHLWIQQHPSQAVQVCVPGYQYVLKHFPFQQALNFFLKSADNCSQVTTVLGLSIPIWSLIGFAGLAIIALALLLKK